MFHKSLNQLITVLKNSKSSEHHIQDAINNFYNAVNETDDTEDVEKSIQSLTALFSLSNLHNGSMASLVCGALVEGGFSAEYIVDDYIVFFKSLIDKCMPFIEFCESKIPSYSNADEEGEEEESIWDIIEQIKEDYHEQYQDDIRALEGLEAYYLCGVAIFSSDENMFKKGYQALAHSVGYTYYAEAFHYLSTLFSVLFHEPFVAIDLNTHQGIQGTFSGIADNFQFQTLLMGQKMLNNSVEISPEMLAVAEGHGEQITTETIIGKWDMCNWEYWKHKTHISENDKMPLSQYWIWNEGKPSDIPIFNNHRVILLDTPSYKRSFSLQRCFNILKAQIHVAKVLGPNEIQTWLDEMGK